mgnify:CR=1 FL=1
MTVSTILNNLQIPSQSVYKSSFSAVSSNSQSIEQSSNVVPSANVSISQSAALMNSISNINAKLQEYEKAVAAGDVSSVAKNLVALKLELANFKEQIKSMQLQFEILNAIMDMIDSAESKINKLSAKTYKKIIAANSIL